MAHTSCLQWVPKSFGTFASSQTQEPRQGNGHKSSRRGQKDQYEPSRDCTTSLSFRQSSAQQQQQPAAIRRYVGQRRSYQRFLLDNWHLRWCASYFCDLFVDSSYQIRCWLSVDTSWLVLNCKLSCVINDEPKGPYKIEMFWKDWLKALLACFLILLTNFVQLMNLHSWLQKLI